MSKTKDYYFDYFANYDYLEMPNHNFEIDWRQEKVEYVVDVINSWKMKEERLEKMILILDKIDMTLCNQE